MQQTNKTKQPNGSPYSVDLSGLPYRLLLATCTLLLSALIFLAPTNLFLKILPNYGYVGGLQIDYLIPKLYLSDLVCFLIVVLGIGCQVSGIRNKKHGKKHTQQIDQATNQLSGHIAMRPYSLLLAACVLLLICRQFFTPYPISALWWLAITVLHLSTAYIGLQWIKEIGIEKFKQTAVLSISIAVIFQSTISLYQFFSQHQLAGFLFFGEPALTTATSLAKGDWSVIDTFFGTSLGLRILPYGTTAHPNILAGFLALSLLTVIRQIPSVFSDKMKQDLLVWSTKLSLLSFSVGIGLLVLFLTFSISAMITLGIGLMLLFLQKNASKKVAVVCCVFFSLTPIWLLFLSDKYSTSSIMRRVYLNQTAVHLITSAPLGGIGINQFAVFADQFLNQKETIRFAQPAHNIFLLFVAENGLLGILILTFFLLTVTRHFKNSSAYLQLFVIILPIISLDHYSYTLVPGQLILVISILVLSAKGWELDET